jgi:predicted phosphoribosyltransferase
MILYEDRRDGGRALAGRLKALAGTDCVVLGLPRGGVPVAYEVARALGAPLDVFLVRKLGSPRDPEFAFGAIASGGVRVLHEADVADLGLDAAAVAAIEERERRELLRREKLYREGRPPAPLAGRIAVLVDDGLATGATMTAAVRAARLAGAARVVAAAPVSSVEAAESLSREADQVVCANFPPFFLSVGSFYRSFPQTTDAEVREFLGLARTTSA